VKRQGNSQRPPAGERIDIDAAPRAEPSPADMEALEQFNRELERAINAEFGSQPF
jgi:hypothetical protein